MNREAFSKIWVLIIFVILVGGGIFVWQYFGTSEEITNWKAYKNEDVRFEVKYPSDLREEWKLPEESFALHEIWGEQVGKRLLLFSMTDSNKVYGFGFSIYSNLHNITLREFSQKLMDWMKLDCHLKTIEDVSLGDKQTPGVKFIFDNCNNSRTPDEIINQILIKENNNIIEISGIGSLSDSEFIENFSKIISTFKFNEPEKMGEMIDETADWKTYRNEEYGFEIKYPGNWTFNKDVMSFGFSSGKLIKGSDEFSCSLSVALATRGVSTEYINSLPKEKWKRSEIDINGKSAIKLVSVDSPIMAHYFLENSGEYSFQIYHDTTRYITNQEGYKVALGFVYNQECMDIFNHMLSTFKVSGLSELGINLLSPNGNEKWKIGENHIISWQGGKGNVISAVLFNEKEEGWWIFSTGIPDGSMEWDAKTVSPTASGGMGEISIQPGKYKIKIGDGYGNSDESDDWFSVIE